MSPRRGVGQDRATVEWGNVCPRPRSLATYPTDATFHLIRPHRPADSCVPIAGEPQHGGPQHGRHARRRPRRRRRPVCRHPRLRHTVHRRPRPGRCCRHAAPPATWLSPRFLREGWEISFRYFSHISLRACVDFSEISHLFIEFYSAAHATSTQLRHTLRCSCIRPCRLMDLRHPAKTAHGASPWPCPCENAPPTMHRASGQAEFGPSCETRACVGRPWAWSRCSSPCPHSPSH